MGALKKRDAEASGERFSIDYSMDDLANDMRDESRSWFKSVYFDSWAVVAVFLAIYVMLVKNHVLGKDGLVREWLSFLFKHELIEDIWDYILENVIIGFVCARILFTIQNKKEKNWIKEHRDYWLKGKWLHIHEKNNNTIRVGYVDFTQSYDSIAAVSRNYDAEDITDDLKTTDWHYVNAQINHDEDNNYGLRAFYSAKKKGNGERNNGMHKLDITNRGENGIPIEMAGSFGDVNTFDVDSHISANEKYLSCGRIRMYRMTAEQEKYLFRSEGNFDPQRFERMLNGEAQFSDEDSFSYIDYVRNSVEKMKQINAENA